MSRVIVAPASASLFLSLAVAAQPATAPRTKERVFAHGHWAEVHRIADDAGRLLTNPQLLAARGDTVYVYDAGTQELIALSRSGAVKWRVGRSGRGPREFSNPVDLQIAPNGNLHILDADVSRITIIDPAGHVADMRTVAERLHRIVPRATGWWGVSLGRPDLLVPVTSEGRPADEASVAAPLDIAVRHILVREPHVAPLPNGGAVVAFVWSSRLLLVDAVGKVTADLDGPEHVPFADVRSYTIETPQKATVQRIDPKARSGAREVAANDTMALVVFGGNTRDWGKVVDRYDLRAKRYVDSARLPKEPAALRIVGNTLVALELDPAPAVVFYEWRRTKQ
jgi:hypothetical protein